MKKEEVTLTMLEKQKLDSLMDAASVRLGLKRGKRLPSSVRKQILDKFMDEVRADRKRIADKKMEVQQREPETEAGFSWSGSVRRPARGGSVH